MTVTGGLGHPPCIATEYLPCENPYRMFHTLYRPKQTKNNKYTFNAILASEYQLLKLILSHNLIWRFLVSL